MCSCRRLQSASSHIRKIILLKTTFIVKWFNWNDHKCQCIADVILRHNYEKLSKILNDNRFDFHDRWHYESINTDNYRFQSLQRISVKIALQLKDNEWREIH